MNVLSAQAAPVLLVCLKDAHSTFAFFSLKSFSTSPVALGTYSSILCSLILPTLMLSSSQYHNCLYVCFLC